ncbi:MAG: ExbD/TolR family protein [Pseudomonadota bacterium]
MAGGLQARGAAKAGRLRRGGARPIAEINVTPFVDVMLVLLIIFMVAAPLLTVGVPLKLPETAAQPLPQPEEEPLTISLDAEGRVYIGRTEVAAGELVAKLSAIADARSDDRVYLRADGGLGYGRVMQVMGALNRGGFRNIGLVTDPEGRGLDEEEG